MEDIESTPSFQVEPSGGRNYQRTGALAGLLTLIIFIAAGSIFLLNRPHNTNQNPPATENPQQKFIANSTLVYGYWTKTASIITARDLSTNKEADLAALPNNIKHVKIISGNKLLYLNNTDQHDYGKELAERDLGTGADRTVLAADPNFGIDDYVVSPNGAYAAVWMMGSASAIAAGAPSRVYTVNAQTGEKHLIYDENSANATPIHYPIAITNTGDLFSDKFLPNSGAGWAYGMSFSDVAGNNKKDIDSMKNGTYSSQPSVSPNGNMMAFAGYSGTDGTLVENGFRKAMVNPNTVEVFDLSSQTRLKISTQITTALYPYVRWDKNSGALIFQAVEKQGAGVTSGFYAYQPGSGSIAKLPDNTLNFYAVLDDKNYLFGQNFPGDSGVGNLGDHYSQGINKLNVFHADTGKEDNVELNMAPIQLISVFPSNYFPIVSEKGQLIASSKDQLQLETFEIKPTLAPKREERQSTVPETPSTPETPYVPKPLCRTITYPQCNSLLGTNYPQDKDIGDIGDPAFSDCVWKAQAQGEAKETCEDSPLYLYGAEGTKVNVFIDAAVSNPNISLTNNMLQATLLENGTFSAGGTIAESLSYDYVSRVKNLPAPEDGVMVNTNNKYTQIGRLAAKMGLNARETAELQGFAMGISSPYLFVSFFDQKTSQDILPLYFDPQPETYRNIVFYFKPLNKMPDVLPKYPVITPIIRTGLTAIEISYHVE
ncbi:MAG: hypothetical protein ACM3IJ_00715 [Candidatus Levyibacteriota bacterium]